MDGAWNANNINNFIDESTRALYKALPVSKKRKKSKNEHDTDVDLARSVSGASISSGSRQLNDFHNALQHIEDPKVKRQAAEGLGRLMKNLGNDPDKSRIERFSGSLDDLKDEDVGAFHLFFVMAYQLSRNGYNLGRWVNVFLSVEDNTLRSAYLAQTRAIVLDDAETHARRRSSLNRMIGAVRCFAEEEPDRGHGYALMADFFMNLGGCPSLDERDGVLETVLESGE